MDLSKEFRQAYSAAVSSPKWDLSSVTTSMIGELLNEQGIEIDRHHILLDGAIRTLGEHVVRARLHTDIIPTFTVKVVSEDKSHLGEETAAE